MGQHRPLFVSFRSFQTFYRKNCGRQRDSNMDRWSRRGARWPLEHHHGPFKIKFTIKCPSFMLNDDDLSKRRTKVHLKNVWYLVVPSSLSALGEIGLNRLPEMNLIMTYAFPCPERSWRSSPRRPEWGAGWSSWRGRRSIHLCGCCIQNTWACCRLKNKICKQCELWWSHDRQTGRQAGTMLIIKLFKCICQQKTFCTSFFPVKYIFSLCYCFLQWPSCFSLFYFFFIQIFN